MILIPYSILVIENDDDRAFMEHIFLSYQRLMYHEINQIVKDSWFAEDILQITVINLIKHIETLRSLSPPKLINYIISASKNTAITQLRKNRRNQEESFEKWFQASEYPNQEVNPEIIILQKEQFNCLANIWTKLDERNRYLLEGRFILHKSYTELGKDLNIKPESVRMAVTRAKRTAYNLGSVHIRASTMRAK